MNLAHEGSARVLLVDDDVILAEMAKARLVSPIMAVETAVNATQALELMERQSFDLALLDIEMPGLDGFDLLAMLRADPRFADIPVIMLTGHDDIESIDRAYQAGANSFIAKPINWRQLSYALRYVLRSTRIETELRRERKRSNELMQLTNNMLSLLKLESRTPLSAIIGFADCIRQEIDGPIGVDAYVKYAAQIDTAARQFQDRLTDLVQYSQLACGAARLEEDEYPARKVIDAATAGLPALAAKRGATFVINRPQQDFFLTCDLRWLARAFAHLIEIAATADDASHIDAALRINGDGAAQLIVRASSRESAAGEAAISTKKSTSIESVRQELGVGVPFARRIAEMHDGELKVETGARVMEIVLPPSRVSPAGNARQTEAA
ncbi:MAG: response regulator [Methylocystis sp.]|nr:response regulator [Methylocystis sp.]